MEEYQEKFVEAEETVVDLVRDLEKLREEIEGFQTSKQVLKETHKELSSAIKAIEILAKKLNDYIEKLDEISIDTILNSIEDFRNETETTQKRFQLLQYGALTGIIIALLLTFFR